MVPNGDIAYALDNLSMAATAEQSHMDQLLATILHLVYNNKILGEQLKQLSKTNAFLARQGQEDKMKLIKLKDTLKTRSNQVLLD